MSARPCVANGTSEVSAIHLCSTAVIWNAACVATTIDYLTPQEGLCAAATCSLARDRLELFRVAGKFGLTRPLAYCRPMAYWQRVWRECEPLACVACLDSGMWVYTSDVEVTDDVPEKDDVYVLSSAQIERLCESMLSMYGGDKVLEMDVLMMNGRIVRRHYGDDLCALIVALAVGPDLSGYKLMVMQLDDIIDYWAAGTEDDTSYILLLEFKAQSLEALVKYIHTFRTAVEDANQWGEEFWKGYMVDFGVDDKYVVRRAELAWSDAVLESIRYNLSVHDDSTQ